MTREDRLKGIEERAEQHTECDNCDNAQEVLINDVPFLLSEVRRLEAENANEKEHNKADKIFNRQLMEENKDLQKENAELRGKWEAQEKLVIDLKNIANHNHQSNLKAEQDNEELRDDIEALQSKLDVAVDELKILTEKLQIISVRANTYGPNFPPTYADTLWDLARYAEKAIAKIQEGK